MADQSPPNTTENHVGRALALLGTVAALEYAVMTSPLKVFVPFFFTTLLLGVALYWVVQEQFLSTWKTPKRLLAGAVVVFLVYAIFYNPLLDQWEKEHPALAALPGVETATSPSPRPAPPAVAQAPVEIVEIAARPLVAGRSALVDIYYRTGTGVPLTDGDLMLSLVRTDPRVDWTTARGMAEKELWQHFERTFSDSKRPFQMSSGGERPRVTAGGLPLSQAEIAGIRAGNAILYVLAHFHYQGSEFGVCAFFKDEDGPAMLCNEHNGKITRPMSTPVPPPIVATVVPTSLPRVFAPNNSGIVSLGPNASNTIIQGPRPPTIQWHQESDIVTITTDQSVPSPTIRIEAPGSHIQTLAISIMGANSSGMSGVSGNDDWVEFTIISPPLTPSRPLRISVPGLLRVKQVYVN